MAKIKIDIDHSKCLGPLNCKKCLQVCPLAVFTCYPLNRERGKICESWELTTAYIDQCIGCGDCERICPEGAIRVVMGEVRVN